MGSKEGVERAGDEQSRGRGHNHTDEQRQGDIDQCSGIERLDTDEEDRRDRQHGDHGRVDRAHRRLVDAEIDELGELQIAFVLDRKSTRLNSSHVAISYAVFCLKKKTKTLYTY